MVEASNGDAFLEGKAECVGESGKTGGFYSREWPREKARFHVRQGGSRNILRRNKKAPLGVGAEVTTVRYRLGVYPEKIQSDRGH